MATGIFNFIFIINYCQLMCNIKYLHFKIFSLDTNENLFITLLKPISL